GAEPGGGREAGRAGPLPGDPAAAGAPPTFFARHPIKIAALVATAVVGLVLFPRGANRPERPQAASAPTGGSGSLEVTPAAIGGGPGALPASLPAGPAAVGGQVIIDVETIPHGGSVFLDTLPLGAPRIVLSLSDPQPHDIIARAGCRQAIAEMTANDLASFDGPLVMELRPREEEVAVVSDPPNARIRLDGRDTGKLTPAKLALSACDRAGIVLERQGYKPWSLEVTPDGDFDAAIRSLGAAVLEPVPGGTILIRKPAEYQVEIFAGDRKLGRAGEPIDLPEGKHTLTFRNEKVFVHETAQVAVAAGKTTSPVVTLPILGTLTVQAQPSNCKVYVDGTYVDVTPVLDMPLAAGGHRVKVVFVPTGAEQEVAVTVNGGKNALVTVKF
ncbi:MAG: PEGA domain-containing protein, partial [Candidatus Polarisedimenticolia bacterium]